MEIVRCKQLSEEWFEAHSKSISASHAQAIGNCGAGLNTYINGLMAEYYSKGEKESFSNKHTDRGNELEPEARVIYEMKNNVIVEEVGYVRYNEYVICSPDGLIGDNGGLEIKSPDNEGYFEIMLDREKAIDTKYMWQVQMNLLITGREWWDLTFYNPNYDESIITFRILPDKDKQDKLLKGFEISEQKIKEIINKLK